MSIIDLNGGKITIGRTEIEVPHKDKIITFVYPAKGQSTYQNVMQQVSKEGLLRPTTAQTLSLINLALQNPDEEHCKDILTKLKNNYLWTSTENLYTKEGVFIYDNINGKIQDDQKELSKRFNEKDPTVRFVQYGFKIGKQSISDFIKNPYIIAQTGQGLEELVENVVSKFKKKPRVFALENVVNQIKRYTAVDSYWVGGRFGVVGGCRGEGWDGCAFGVSKTGEASAKK